MVVCVCGPMAAGKNAASSILEKHGFVSVDADKVVHEILATKEFQEKVIETFQKYAEARSIELRNEDGSLNRRNLGALIFNDKKLLALQESLVLPEVDRKIYEFLDEHKDKDRIINATVLYKISSMKACDRVIFVNAPLFTRFKRAKLRDKMAAKQIFQRFWSQRNLFSKYKKSNADTVKVKNTGNLMELEEKLISVVSRK